MSNSQVILHGVRTEDKASWTLTEDKAGFQELSFEADRIGFDPAVILGKGSHKSHRKKHLLADYDPKTSLLRTYPISTKAGSIHMFEPKYGNIEKLAIERQRPIKSQLDDDEAETSTASQFVDLPSGFQRSMYEGLGLIYPLRYIIEAFDGIEGVSGIVFCRDAEISRDGADVRLPLTHYDEVRRAMKRAHDAALAFAARDKAAYATSELTDKVLKIVSADAFRQGTDVLRERVAQALSGERSRARKTANAESAVKTVRAAAKDLASNAPEELYKLNSEIELVSLTRLIEVFKEKIGKQLSENHWQKFLTANPFILKLAFGYPVSIFGEQVSVGGGKFKQSTGKIADYLVRSGLLGNVSLIEIKKPSTKLLDKAAYRGDVYSPSKELSGSVTQILDQRYRLQQEITQKKENEDIRDIWAYAVACTVIAGRIPDGKQERKSLELYRSNLRDVVVVTFDELLEKLTSLHDFLSSNSNASTIEPVLLDEEDSSDEPDADWEDVDLEADED